MSKQLEGYESIEEYNEESERFSDEDLQIINQFISMAVDKREEEQSSAVVVNNSEYQVTHHLTDSPITVDHSARLELEEGEYYSVLELTGSDEIGNYYSKFLRCLGSGKLQLIRTEFDPH